MARRRTKKKVRPGDKYIKKAQQILRKENHQVQHTGVWAPVAPGESIAEPVPPARETPRIVIKPRKPTLESKPVYQPTLPLGKHEKYAQMAFDGFNVPEEIPERNSPKRANPVEIAPKRVWDKGEDPNTLDQPPASKETDVCPFLGERCLGPRCMMFQPTQDCAIPALSNRMVTFESKVDGFLRHFLALLESE